MKLKSKQIDHSLLRTLLRHEALPLFRQALSINLDGQPFARSENASSRAGDFTKQVWAIFCNKRVQFSNSKPDIVSVISVFFADEIGFKQLNIYKLFAAGVSFLINYFGYKFLVYRQEV